MTLSRQTQKVFAGNANADMLAVFGSMKTGTPQYSTSLSTLQSTEYTEGWSEAILNDKAPYLEEMNAVQYGLSYQIAYLLQQGIPEWDANTTYKTNSLVQVVENDELVIKRSKVDNNLGNLTSNTTYWANYYSASVLGNYANIALTNTAPTIAFATKLNNAGIRTVVETWSNGANWYRVWSDNWCEQGGHATVSKQGLTTISLLKTLANTNYNIQVALTQTKYTAPNYPAISIRQDLKTISSFQVATYQNSADCDWLVSGYKA